MWSVYILQSEKDKKRYIGSTNNLDRRLLEHNNGLVRSTVHRRPLKVIHSEEFEDEISARKREHFYKTHKGYNELKRILAK